jgi:hypothetical protein
MQVVAAFALVMASMGILASAAQASTDHSVNIVQACNEQHGYANGYSGWGGPYGIVCLVWSFSIPWGLTATPVGGLNIQAYCTRHYPGSRAVLTWWSPNGWVCRS